MKLLQQQLQPKRESLAGDIQKLAKRKLASLNALELCDMFIERGAEKIKNDVPPLDYQDKMYYVKGEQEIIDYSYLEMANLGISDEFSTLSSDCWGLNLEENKVCTYIRHQLFIGLIAELEDFISTLVLLILNAYPERLPDVELPLEKVKFKDLKDKESLEDMMKLLGLNSEETLAIKVTNKVSSHVREMLYGSQYDYAKKIRSYLQVDDNFLAEEWLYYCEMYSRRNAGIHAGWKMTTDYKKLVENINKNSRLNLTITNQGFLGFDSDYFGRALEISKRIVRNIEVHGSNHFSALLGNNTEIASAD